MLRMRAIGRQDGPEKRVNVVSARAMSCDECEEARFQIQGTVRAPKAKGY